MFSSASYQLTKLDELLVTYPTKMVQSSIWGVTVCRLVYYLTESRSLHRVVSFSCIYNLNLSYNDFLDLAALE